MPINFTCRGCGQVLRVADEAAGKRAKCPKCHQVVEVPVPEPLEPVTPAQTDDWGVFSETPLGTDAANPYLAPAAPQNLPAASMPASPFRRDKMVNVPTDVGSILDYAVQVWKDNLGLLVGAWIVTVIISGAVSFGSEMVSGGLMRAGQPEAAFGITLLLAAGRFVVDTFLYAGFCRLMLRMARRQRAEFNDLFNAGPVLLPVIGVSILFGLAVGLGFVFLIVPGIIIALFWWPCYYLVVDEKTSVTESFGVAREITANNLGTSVLIWLVSLGITGLGLLACCVGLIVAVPLAGMVTVVAYLMMSGQIPPDPLRQHAK